VKKVKKHLTTEEIKRVQQIHEKAQELEMVKQYIKLNKLKRVDKRLQVIKLYLEGKKQQEIAAKTDYSREWVNKLCSQYRQLGLIEYARHKYDSNNRAMTIEEEEEILSRFEDDSKKGRLVIINTIKKAFDEKRGKETGRSYIYALLKRHEARKLMPRTQHPKKASDEVIETSKKLTLGTMN
jgi:transposase